MIDLEIFIDILACHIVFVQKHQRGVLQNFVFTDAAFFQITDVVCVGDKYIFDIIEVIEVDALHGFRLSDQSDIDLVLVKKAQGFIGGLTADGDADMRIASYEFLQVGEQHIFAEGCADADLQMADTQCDGALELVLSGT